MIERVTPHLRPEESKEVVQGYLSVKDLTTTELAPWLNDVSRARATRVAQGNAKLLELASRQLGAAPDSTTVTLLERLFDRQLICPLGGKFQCEQGHWQSTAVAAQESSDQITPYTNPLLTWFRGVEARLVHVNQQLTLHAELVLQRQ